MIPRFFGALLLLLLTPLLLLVAGAIALADGRPVIFAQPRLGLARRPFTIYKFRTMRDGQVTRLGRLLRATGIDELPQLWHIVRADMAFVGPRPLTAADVARLAWTGSHYDVRWSVRPGITGPAQLSRRCHRRFSWVYDRHYVTHRSLPLDLCVLLRSAIIPLTGKHWGKRIAHIFKQHRS